jgi:hypothetical protein
MSRAFPTQIIEYLTKNFGQPSQFPLAVIQSHIGKVAGLLNLYDRLPDELIGLSAVDYVDLIAAIETVRYGTDRYRAGNNPDCLLPVGPALGTAWTLIEKLKDEVPSTAHDLSFIGDPEFRDMIGLDISAVSTDLQSGEWKGATILAGSCCEALLLYGLQTRETKVPGSVVKTVAAITWPGGNSPRAADLVHRSWDLFSYTEAAHHLGLITDTTKSELGPARDYRNLIHPAKTIREKVRCDRGTAFVAAGALEHVLSDLRRTL